MQKDNELEIDLDDQSTSEKSKKSKSTADKSSKKKKTDQNDKSNSSKSLKSRIEDVEQGLKLQKYDIKAYFANDDKNKQAIIHNIKSLNNNIVQLIQIANKNFEENQKIQEHLKQLVDKTESIHEVQKQDID